MSCGDYFRQWQKVYMGSVRANPKGVDWTPQPLPEYPGGFSAELFVLPSHAERLSRIINAHPRDVRIQFDEEPHIYYVDGIPCAWSVTGLVHKFCGEFDADETIARMQKGRNWPRAKYASHSSKRRRLCGLLVADSLALSNVSHEELDAARAVADSSFAPSPEVEGDELQEDIQDSLVDSVRDLMKVAQASPIKRCLPRVVAELADTGDEIKEKWSRNAASAANKGTWMHLQCELWLNRDHCYCDGPEMEMFLQYVRRLARHRVTTLRTEWEVFAEDLDLAGSVDFVGVITSGPDEGCLWVVDWKRTKKLREQDNHMYGEMMEGPLKFIPDSGKWHYALQLNSYAHIIERYYGRRVVHMEVACFHPDNGNAPYYFGVPRMREVTDYMMAFQADKSSTKALHRAQTRLGANPTLPSLMESKL